MLLLTKNTIFMFTSLTGIIILTFVIWKGEYPRRAFAAIGRISEGREPPPRAGSPRARAANQFVHFLNKEHKNTKKSCLFYMLLTV